MKPAVRNFLILILLLILTGASIGIYLYTKKSPDLSKVKADFILMASELVEEFNQNDTSASAKYVDKIVEVTGLITVIEKTGDNTINVTLLNEGQMSGVICTFQGVADPATIEIKEGELITIRGICSGMLMDVLLNNCVVVR